MPSLLPSGSSRTATSLSIGSFWIGLALAGGAIALSVLGFSLEDSRSPLEPPPVVRLEETNLPINPSAGGTPFVSGPALIVLREEPIPDELTSIKPLHQLELTEHEGRRVYRIRATAYGDELLVDFLTGKLIGVRETPRRVLPLPPMLETIISSS